MLIWREYIQEQQNLKKKGAYSDKNCTILSKAYPQHGKFPINFCIKISRQNFLLRLRTNIQPVIKFW